MFYDEPVKSLFLTTEDTETTEKSFSLQTVASEISVSSAVNL
jgi:hypothetical protein